MIKKSVPFFFRFWKGVRLSPNWQILSFEFYPKAVYFECKFWILRSAITHIQNWAIERQRAGSSENDVIYSLA